jgi:hypothetical protein
MILNLTTMSLPDLRMDGWMDGNIQIFIGLFVDKNIFMIDLLDFNVK